MYNQDKKVSDFGFWQSSVGGFLKGIIWALGLTLVLLTVSSLIITYTPVSESVIPVLSMLCAVVSVAIGGMVSAKTASSKGYLKGALCGITYILVLYIIASLVSEQVSFTSHTLVMFVIGIIVGALGGIMGINSGGRRKR